MSQDLRAFRILVVDDDPASGALLREAMRTLKRDYEFNFAWDGLDALDFLHRRGRYAGVVRPDLILLDIGMPRMDGLEALAAIKDDPDLCAIPVIMLSTSGRDDDVSKSYKARANCYVQKPMDLERSLKLVQAMEDFWVEFVRLPAHGDRQLSETARSQSPALTLQARDKESGPTIAMKVSEASEQAMYSADSSERTNGEQSVQPGCEEHNRLLDEFGVSIRELLVLHQQQFRAIIDGDGECSRFDLLIHMANEKKHAAKYAYLGHVEAHGCSNFRCR